MAEWLRNRLSDLGVLRGLMFGLGFVVVALAPLAGDQAIVDDWRIVPTVLAPTLLVVLVFVVPLDMVMTAVFMSGKEALERARLKRVGIMEAVLVVVLLAAWSPMLLSLVR